VKRALAIGVPILLVFTVLTVWLLPRYQRMRSLRSAQAKWSACAIASYTWVQSAGGFMIGPKHVQIVVRGGAATSATIAGEPQRLKGLIGHPLTVPELFTWIEAAVGSDRFDATYDPRCGYPLTFSIDRSRNATDDEFGLQVVDLQPAQPA